jgi:hypothetical protein
MPSRVNSELQPSSWRIGPKRWLRSSIPFNPSLMASDIKATEVAVSVATRCRSSSNSIDAVLSSIVNAFVSLVPDISRRRSSSRSAWRSMDRRLSIMLCCCAVNSEHATGGGRCAPGTSDGSGGPATDEVPVPVPAQVPCSAPVLCCRRGTVSPVVSRAMSTRAGLQSAANRLNWLSLGGGTDIPCFFEPHLNLFNSRVAVDADDESLTRRRARTLPGGGTPWCVRCVAGSRRGSIYRRPWSPEAPSCPAGTCHASPESSGRRARGRS